MLKSFLILLFTAIFMLTLCMTAPAHAAHPLATDDTGTQGKLKFQTETTAEFGWDRENEHGITTTSSIQTLNVAVTAGILDSIDLALSYPYIWQRIEDNTGNKLDNSGLSDLSLSLKWRFLEVGSTSFAIKRKWKLRCIESLTGVTNTRQRRSIS